MSKNIIVQIKVKEAIDNQMAYIIPDYPWILIPKSTCTVIKTVEHVQELEQQIKDLQAKLNTYEIEESVTMKHVQPEPQRKSLGIYQGVEIFENTKSWFVVKDKLIIIEHQLSKSSNIRGAFEECVYYTKCYLTPKEANARLKEIVREKAEDYPVSITVKQWFSNNKQLIHYAIEAFEKKFNVKYIED